MSIKTHGHPTERRSTSSPLEHELSKHLGKVNLEVENGLSLKVARLNLKVSRLSLEVAPVKL